MNSRDFMLLLLVVILGAFCYGILNNDSKDESRSVTRVEVVA